MIKCCENGKLVKCESLLTALGLFGTPVVSVVGAGGKTTLITRLAEEYRRNKTPVIVTTTTHMAAENQPWFLLEPSPERAREILEQEGMVWVGVPVQEKMKMPPVSFLEEILQWGCPVLIEADGAKHHPLKVPAEHEPVILPQTTHVVSVYGLDAVGKTFQEVCFRTELACEILGKTENDIVCPEDIAALMLSEQGGRKTVDVPETKIEKSRSGNFAKVDRQARKDIKQNCREERIYQVVLNKADNAEREEIAMKICRLAEQKEFSSITVMAKRQ